jgi:hypothetical protein
MTAGKEGARESLRFRLEGGAETVGTWGHEYVRCAQRELPSCPVSGSASAPVLLHLRALKMQPQQSKSQAPISAAYYVAVCVLRYPT